MLTTHRLRRALAGAAAVVVIAGWLGLLGVQADGWARPVQHIAVPEGGRLVQSTSIVPFQQPAPVGPAETPIRTDVDTVITLKGDMVTGKVIDISAEGTLRLTGPQFEGDVRLLASAIDRVTFKRNKLEAGTDEVALTNGDRIVCTITAIGPDAVTVKTKWMGELTVARSAVRAIGLAGARVSLVRLDVASRRMDPWKVKQGTWTMPDDALTHSAGRGSWDTIYAPLEQAEPVTAEAIVEGLDGNYVSCAVVLFAENHSHEWGGNGVFAYLESSRVYLYDTTGNSNNTIWNHNLGQSLKRVRLRFAYDPGAGKVWLWVNGKAYGEHKVPNPTKQGKFVMFRTNRPVKITTLRVLPGVVLPSGQSIASGGGGEKEDADVVHFANGDRLEAQSVSLEGDAAKLVTKYGELSVKRKSIGRIAFRTRGREEPRKHKTDVTVSTYEGRLTLQFEQLTAEQLTGHAPHVGRVTVQRAALRSVRFNVYR